MNRLISSWNSVTFYWLVVYTKPTLNVKKNVLMESKKEISVAGACGDLLTNVVK